MKIPRTKILVASASMLITVSVRAWQQETLYSFQSDQGHPVAPLVQGDDGKFYGTTALGGRYGFGTVFQVTTNGVLRTLADFDGVNGDGALPQSALVLGSDHNFCGTGYHGGSEDNGTVFRLTTNGVITVLLEFNGVNGSGPNGLVLGSDGNLYGTTFSGGPGGGGTIFRLVMPRLSRMTRQPAGNFLLTGTGPANEAYRLWAGTDFFLPFTHWTRVTNGFFDSNGNLSCSDVSATNNTSRFYRISVP